MKFKLKERLQFKQSVLEELPSLAKLVSSFRKPVNQHFWQRLWVFDITCLPLESYFVACLVVEMPEM